MCGPVGRQGAAHCSATGYPDADKGFSALELNELDELNSILIHSSPR